MKLYRRFIRPMHGYPGPHYEPKTEPIEKEEKWYPEEEREHLENKYGYLNKRSFSDLVFEEKYEPCDDIAPLKEKEEYKVPVQSLIDHIKTAADVDPWAKEMAEKLLKKQEPIKAIVDCGYYRCGACKGYLVFPIGDSKERFCENCGQAVRY